MQVCEKYQSLAREAMRVGNRVAAENLLQHAEHYYRVLSANGVAGQGSGPKPRQDGDHVGLGANPPGIAREPAGFTTAEPRDQGPRDQGQAGSNGPMDAANRPPSPRRQGNPPRRRPVVAKVETEGQIKAEAGPKTASGKTASGGTAAKPDSDHAA